MIGILDFENQVSLLEEKIKELIESPTIKGLDVSSEITRLQQKVDRLLVQIYQKLTPSQRIAVARHPNRPKFLDYLENLFDDFVELSGDRVFGEDNAIIGGLAKFKGLSCVVIGQEKGKDTETRLKHNFGMPKPEGYRKVYRLFEMANKFDLPIITFIDTSGAYPGLESEERGQAESIAKCIEKSFQINIPFISIIIGEGGSGGAIALASSDYVLMLENSVYSVISPEGCASILWKDDSKTATAADALKITAPDLYALKIIDYVVKEPTGGAHRKKGETINIVGESIMQYLEKSLNLDKNERIIARRNRFLLIGDAFVI